MGSESHCVHFVCCCFCPEPCRQGGSQRPSASATATASTPPLAPCAAPTESPTCLPASPAAPAGTLRNPQADLDPASLRSAPASSPWSCHANFPVFSFSSGYVSLMLNPPPSSAAHELNNTLPLLLPEVCSIIQRTKVSASEDECHLLRRRLSVAIGFLSITRGRKSWVKVSVKPIEATRLVYVSTAALTGFLVTVCPPRRT